jgi:hypothetical protein
MKAKIIPILASVFFLLFFLASCEDSTYKIYKGNDPVYMSYEELRSAIQPDLSVQLENPGKIYFKDNYIFIVEEQKGIHVYDNSNPASPVRKNFVKVPGVVDLSVSGYILYADSYVDMVALDVQNVDNIHEIARVKDVFPYTVPPTGNDYPMAYIDQKKGVVIDWELKTIKEKVQPPNVYPYPIYWERGDLFLYKANAGGASTGVSGSGVGVGGSMARFGIKGDVLYIVDENNLKIFDITTKTNPVKISDFYPGWGIETMFLTEKNMFLGTSTGMLIYDISVPLTPQFKSSYNHIRSCDPVVVDDTLAYVTLRSGTTCGGTVNVLDVVNIKNITSPSLVMSYAMTNPHGLGKDGNLLFICDGSAGLKIYDATDPYSITVNMVYAYPNIKSYDVIPIGEVLVLIGDDGLYQYDYSNPSSISLLSKIEVIKE